MRIAALVALVAASLSHAPVAQAQASITGEQAIEVQLVCRNLEVSRALGEAYQTGDQAFLSHLMQHAVQADDCHRLPPGTMPFAGAVTLVDYWTYMGGTLTLSRRQLTTNGATQTIYEFAMGEGS